MEKKSKLRSGDVVGAISSIDGVDGKTDIGAIDIRESITYVEILNGKGALVLEELPKRTMKGKYRKVHQDKRKDRYDNKMRHSIEDGKIDAWCMLLSGALGSCAVEKTICSV